MSKEVGVKDIMGNVIDFKTGVPITQLQREWVETVANESVDNLDMADIMGLIDDMEKFYGPNLPVKS
jgi:hypothetical protein|tara:strand:+ start:251 stop:451 length:201 start_codon:yes stop_codon:yes gene_type:complete